MELWDLYDKHRTLTNQTMTRGDAMLKDTYHLVIHVVIFNSKNQMLIQKRQGNKIGAPDMWDISAGGSVTAGETSQQGAMRETEEELGLIIDLHNQRPHLSITFERGYDDIYIVNREADLETLAVPNEEVSDAAWASIEEIYQMIDDKAFISYRKSLIQLLFHMRYQYGAVKRD
ncbi:NUDIX hydrolase [Jeotgalicoccus halotolerans]|uniref:Isopentenyldiphosphate isomerase n=1 Tax=Jeotgalicoccus halotolerans TaxID=157227 RepID=A0A3E0B306_9STAP|nr:NUDIX domain-containing protein [Jeotgalicoccus halotolerans]REG25522.1 isopentenyldiphosphate isomerase [Jeotgalicoccus halotolerans]